MGEGIMKLFMKIIWSFFFIVQPVSAQNIQQADYYCTDGSNLEIGIFYDTDSVVETGMLKVFVPPVFNKKNYIKIYQKGEELPITLANVMITTDGAGNDTFQVLAFLKFGYEIVAEFSYEHQGAYLTGFYRKPIRGNYPLCEYGEGCYPIIGFKPDKVILEAEKIKCIGN